MKKNIAFSAQFASSYCLFILEILGYCLLCKKLLTLTMLQ